MRRRRTWQTGGLLPRMLGSMRVLWVGMAMNCTLLCSHGERPSDLQFRPFPQSPCLRRAKALSRGPLRPQQSPS